MAPEKNSDGSTSEPRASAPNYDPNSEEAPIVQIVKGVGINVDQEGSFARIKVGTLTQGDVVLHVEPPMITELITMLIAARNATQQFAGRAGKAPRIAMAPVQTFAVGEIPNMPGAMMLGLNFETQSEQLFLIPDANFAREIAKGLAKEADAADLRVRGIIAPRPAARGLLGPGGQPLGPINGTKQ